MERAGIGALMLSNPVQPCSAVEFPARGVAKSSRNVQEFITNHAKAAPSRAASRVDPKSLDRTRTVVDDLRIEPRVQRRTRRGVWGAICQLYPAVNILVAKAMSPGLAVLNCVRPGLSAP